MSKLFNFKNKFISTFSVMKLKVGSFYKVETFLVKLYNKFSFLTEFIQKTRFELSRIDSRPVVADEDRIITKAAAYCLAVDSGFKGFCGVTAKKYLNKIKDRTTPYDRVRKREVKLNAITKQLTSSVFNCKKSSFDKARKLVRRDLLIEKASLEVSSNELALEQLKKSATAGFWWFQKKGLVLDEILAAANTICTWNMDDIASIIAFPTYVAYRVQQRASGVKLRVIYVYPAVITLLEQKFLGPVLEYFLSVNQQTPYVIGNVGADLVKRWYRWQSRHKIVSVDWQAFDHTANQYLIKEAFAIVRSMFPKLGLKDAFIFDLITWFFLFTPIYTSNPEIAGEDGIAIKQRGIPSGSSFTNLIGTIVNMLATYTYLVDKGYEVNGSLVAVLGDDIVIATSNEFSLGDFGTCMNKWFGMSVSVEKSAIFKKGERVYFLGASFDNKGRYVNAELALLQCGITTSDLYIKCSNSRDHFKRVRDKIASVCFKYSDGYKLYDKLIYEIRRFLNVYDVSDEFYIEIGQRLTSPGLPTKDTLKRTADMRSVGWLIQ